jgi:hypothetical protein
VREGEEDGGGHVLWDTTTGIGYRELVGGPKRSVGENLISLTARNMYGCTS